MFQVVLSDILWANKTKKLPKKWTYEVCDMDEVTWQELFSDNFRGNRFEFHKLLRDVFQVEAERQHGCGILQCKIDIRRNK